MNIHTGSLQSQPAWGDDLWGPYLKCCIDEKISRRALPPEPECVIMEILLLRGGPRRSHIAQTIRNRNQRRPIWNQYTMATTYFPHPPGNDSAERVSPNRLSHLFEETRTGSSAEDCLNENHTCRFLMLLRWSFTEWSNPVLRGRRWMADQATAQDGSPTTPRRASESSRRSVVSQHHAGQCRRSPEPAGQRRQLTVRKIRFRRHADSLKRRGPSKSSAHKTHLTFPVARDFGEHSLL